MPTELKRYTINVSSELSTLLQKEADANERSLASQVVWIMKRYYAAKQEEAGLFNPSELREEERRSVPFFETRQTQERQQPKELP